MPADMASPRTLMPHLQCRIEKDPFSHLQVVQEVVDGALLCGKVLSCEAKEGNHGQAPVLDLPDLHGLKARAPARPCPSSVDAGGKVHVCSLENIQHVVLQRASQPS